MGLRLLLLSSFLSLRLVSAYYCFRTPPPHLPQRPLGIGETHKSPSQGLVYSAALGLSKEHKHIPAIFSLSVQLDLERLGAEVVSWDYMLACK